MESQAQLNFASYDCFPVEEEAAGRCGAVPTLFRTRKPNWTEQESLHLAALVDSHHILRSRMMDSNTNQQKTETWTQIAARVNQMNPAVQRTVEEVKRRWQNMYSTAKREAAEFRRAVAEADGAAPEVHQFLCPISLRLVDTFGGVDNLGVPTEGYSAEDQLSSETGSSRSRVPSVECSLTLPMVSPQPPIKREEFLLTEEAAVASQWRPRRLLVHAAVQTDAEAALRLETLSLQRDILLADRERRRLRVQRERVRADCEQRRLQLRLERRRLKNARLRLRLREEGGEAAGE